jgi:uncharacterized protein YmfQ (DUF2313 family)
MATRSLEDQTQSIANWLPSGRVWNAKNVAASVMRSLLRGLAHELLRASVIVNALRTELMPGTAVQLLPEWEAAVGIPSTCFPGTGSISERQRDVITKIAGLGVQTQRDFEKLAALFGVTVEVHGGAVHGLFPMEFPIVFFDTPKSARFTIVCLYELPASLHFPYTFPIPFSLPAIVTLECVFSKLKPANCDIVFVRREPA